MELSTQIELLKISYKLMELYNYIDDEDCKLNDDDFSQFISDDLHQLMKTLKDRYYELYSHRKHQRV